MTFNTGYSGSGLRMPTAGSGLGFKMPIDEALMGTGISATPNILADIEKYGSGYTGYLNSAPNVMSNLGSQGGAGSFLNNYGGLALGALQGVGNLFMGMQQYGMAKKALNESTRQFNVNYDAQKKLTNSRLEDRQRARLAADPNAHQSVDQYMNRYGI